MDRTKLRRKPSRGSHDRAVIDAILDEALICHVGFVADHGPVVIPTTFVRIADDIYLHGAGSNAMLAGIARGCCVTVTLVDALVLGKTARHHSVNYRSVMIFGSGALVEDDDGKRTALFALLDKAVPERSRACKPPDADELASTQVVRIPTAEASAKIRSGPPLADDPALPYWSGLIPLITTRGEPQPF